MTIRHRPQPSIAGRTMMIRPENPGDARAIDDVIRAAFATAPHSSGTEAAIVDALRRANALSISLVAEMAGELVGYAAFSPVSINREETGWFGLGPVAVLPDRQRCGIGGS